MGDTPEPQATPNTPPVNSPPAPPETDASKAVSDAVAAVSDRLNKVETVVNDFIEKMGSKGPDAPPVEPVAPAPERRPDSPPADDPPLKAEKKSGKYGSSLVFGSSD